MAGIDIAHVPYNGTAPALRDLLGGQITFMFAQTSAALPHVQAGKLRALGVASAKRAAQLPDLPTITESGLPGFEAVSWYALLAPAGTPKEVAVKLQSEVARILQMPDACGCHSPIQPTTTRPMGAGAICTTASRALTSAPAPIHQVIRCCSTSISRTTRRAPMIIAGHARSRRRRIG